MKKMFYFGKQTGAWWG